MFHLSEELEQECKRRKKEIKNIKDLHRFLRSIYQNYFLFAFFFLATFCHLLFEKYEQNFVLFLIKFYTSSYL